MNVEQFFAQLNHEEAFRYQQYWEGLTPPQSRRAFQAMGVCALFDPGYMAAERQELSGTHPRSELGV